MKILVDSGIAVFPEMGIPDPNRKSRFDQHFLAHFLLVGADPDAEPTLDMTTRRPLSSMGTDDVMTTPSSGSIQGVLAARLESLCHGNAAAQSKARRGSARRNENQESSCILPRGK